jgi:hypothetical protein
MVKRVICRLTKNLYRDEMGLEQRKNNNGPPGRSISAAAIESSITITWV